MESLKKENQKHSKRKAEDGKSFMKYYALAFELVLANVLLIFGGYYVDKALSLSPLFILLGTFLAMAFTIWLLIKFKA